MPAQVFLQRRAFASVSAAELAALQSLLSAQEQASLPPDPRVRQRRIIARGLLRQWLGELLACDPRHLDFDYGEQGKPALSRFPLQFNLAHSRRQLVLAWTRAPLPLGVDVEDLGARPRAARLQSVLSPGERDLLARSAQPESLFLAFWTRKEALLKAQGGGISQGLDTLDTAPLERRQFQCAETTYFLATEFQDDAVVSLAAGTTDPPALIWRNP